MKKLLTLLFLIEFVYTAKAQTNVYHPFPDSNAVWGMSSGCGDMINQCGNFVYNKLYYDGDTVISGYSYKKIAMQNGTETNGSCCGIPYPYSGGLGFLRQNTSGRKVYWRDQWMTSDTLLYDFTLNVGDTLTGFLNCGNSPPLTVFSIDSILVGSSYRKRINFDSITMCAEYYSIIEGIGGTTGLGIPLCTAPFQNGNWLLCFSINSNIIYTSSPPCSLDTIPCGQLPTGIDDLLFQTRKIVSVFPNPSIDKITLHCDAVNLPVRIAVYDLLGTKYMETEINTDASEINIAELPAGVYFLQAENNTLLTNYKLIKQ